MDNNPDYKLNLHPNYPRCPVCYSKYYINLMEIDERDIRIKTFACINP